MNKNNKSNEYRKVAIELLYEYISNQQSLIWEYSGNFDKSYAFLNRKVNKYLTRLDVTEEEKEEILKTIDR